MAYRISVVVIPVALLVLLNTHIDLSEFDTVRHLVLALGNTGGLIAVIAALVGWSSYSRTVRRK